MDVEKIILSPADMAKVLNLSPSGFFGLVSKGIIDKVEKGQYNLLNCVKLYLQYKQTQWSSDSEGQKDELEKEKILLTKIKREKEEISLKVIKGEVHLSEDVEIIVNDMIAGFKSKLLNLSSKVAPKIENRPAYHIKLELDKEIEEVLQELSEYDPQQFHEISKKYVDLNTDDEDESY